MEEELSEEALSEEDVTFSVELSFFSDTESFLAPFLAPLPLVTAVLVLRESVA